MKSTLKKTTELQKNKKGNYRYGSENDMKWEATLTEQDQALTGKNVDVETAEKSPDQSD